MKADGHGLWRRSPSSTDLPRSKEILNMGAGASDLLATPRSRSQSTTVEDLAAGQSGISPRIDGAYILLAPSSIALAPASSRHSHSFKTLVPTFIMFKEEGVYTVIYNEESEHALSQIGTGTLNLCLTSTDSVSRC